MEESLESLKQVIEGLKADLKAAGKLVKKQEREIQRLSKDNEVLAVLNEKASHLREVIERDQEKRSFYNDLLLENSPDIFILVDENLNTLMATASFYLKSPFTRDRIEGGVYLDSLFQGYVTQESIDNLNRRVRAVLRDRTECRYEERMAYEDHEEIYEITLRPAVTGSGTLIGAILVFADTTELVHARENAEAADQAKSNFLANMSHEIRTPMNAINGMAEFIIRDTTDQQARENAAQIKIAASSLLGIINDILDFSKIEAGKMEIIDVPYQPSSLLVDVGTMIMIRLEDKPVRLILDVDENLPCSLVGDEIRLKQILINILNNAVKFTREGTITLKVRYKTEAENRVRMFFSVTDTGIGIKQDDIGKLFSIFSQVDTRKNRAVEGTGLGLAISQRLVHAMDGDIHVESVYGEGTTFSWDVVNGIDDAQPMGKLNRQAAIGNVRSFRNTFTAPEAKVLIVDDNAVNLKVAEGILRPYHCRITTAASGAESVALAMHERFDIIFMDHMMPVMDGVEAMQKIRRLSDFKDVAIIALTANAISGVREKYKSLGFEDFLAKPIEMKEMDAVLKRFLPEELRQPVTEEDLEAEDPGQDDEILRQVWKDGEKKCALLLGYVLAGDWANYTIEVHALKSVAAAIGETELSEMAKRQEQAGKEEDKKTILLGFPKLLEKYQALVGRLAEKYASEEPEPADDLLEALSDEAWVETVSAARQAYEDFDLELVTEKLNELLTHRMPDEARQHILAAVEAADEFDYDTVEEHLKKLTKGETA